MSTVRHLAAAGALACMVLSAVAAAGGGKPDASYDEARALFSYAFHDTWCHDQLERGIALAKKQQLARALVEFDACLARHPRDYEAMATKGAVLAAAGRPRDGLRILDEAIALHRQAKESKSSRSWESKPRTFEGMAYASLGEFDSALGEYGQAIELDPHEDAAYAGRGLVYMRLKRYAPALADFHHVVERRPAAVEGWVLQGMAHMALYEAQDWNEADEDTTHLKLGCQSFQKACDLGDCRAKSQHPECRKNEQKLLENSLDDWLNGKGDGKQP